MKNLSILTRSVCLSICALGLPFAALAHHSFGAFYEMGEGIEVEGEITSVFWRNPHIRFTMDVTNDDRSVSTWDMEAGSVNTLERHGVGQDVITVGTNLRAWGPASRHGLDSMFVISMIPEGGEEVVLNPNLAALLPPPSGEPLPEELGLDSAVVAAAQAEADSIFRVWIPESRPRTGSGEYVWPLTEAGQAALDSWDPLEDDPALRCIPPGIPVAMDNPYPFEFIDNGDTITLRLEEWDGVRTIYMTDDASPDDVERPHMGFSVGSWEGNTLTVTTTHVDYPFFDDVGTPQSPEAVIVEHFTLRDDETRLDWEATITDPVNFSSPATLAGTWAWSPGEQIKRYECTP